MISLTDVPAGMGHPSTAHHNGGHSSPASVQPAATPKPVDEAVPTLRWDGRSLELASLTPHSAEVDSSALAEYHAEVGTGTIHDAELAAGDQSRPVHFRVRRVAGDRVRIGFHDLSIDDRGWIESLGSSRRDGIHARSYDELAGSGGPKPVDDTKPRTGAVRKLAAVGLMVALIAGVATWLAYLMQAQSTIAVNNSVLVGNYLPVNLPRQGRIETLHVAPGDEVHAGDLLATVVSEESTEALAAVETSHRRAVREAEAHRRELQHASEMISYVAEKVARDIDVARADLRAAEARESMARAQLRRLEPLMSRGNVAAAEIDEARALLATADAEKVKANAVIKSLEFVGRAAESNILVTDNGTASPLSEIETRVALAEANVQELAETRDRLATTGGPVELTAPADGRVYAVYRGEGETVKVAEELLAVSGESEGWAAGHVAADSVMHVKPGQLVEIYIPSLDIETVGRVQAVGHRAVYGRGQYHAEFRGGPLEVPIRVALDLGDVPVPSGLRLDMTVRVRDPLKELKTWAGEKRDWFVETFQDWTSTGPETVTAAVAS